MKNLTIADTQTLKTIALAAAAAKGPEFFGWKNPPEFVDGRWTIDGEEVASDEVTSQWEAKLNGAYGERFLLTVAYIQSAVKAGVEVCLLQKQAEPGLPFDAQGWVVVSIGTYPMFHIAPWDLPMEEVDEAGLVNIVVEGSDDDRRHAWKQTNKIEEFTKLLDWLS